MLCTITDIKTRLGLAASTEFDTLMTAIVAGVSAMADRYCNRVLLAPTADVTEYYAGGCDLLWVNYYPIMSVTSIKESYGDYDFAGADALVADSDYRLLKGGRTGIIKRLYTDWPDIDDAVQIVYRGGYLAAGETPAEGSDDIVLPDDLREAAILQSCLLFKRRDDIGLSSQSFQGGSLNVFSKLDFEPLVKQTLDAYRRVTL